MSKHKGDETPDYIAKHKKLYTHATQMVDTSRHVHAKAHSLFVEKHLTDKEGVVHMDWADNPDVQEKGARTMADFYDNNIKQYLKIAKDLNENEKGLLSRAIHQVALPELKGLMREHGKNLTSTLYAQIAEQRLIPQLQQNLYSSAAAHITEKHIPGATKYLGLEGKLTHALDKDELSALLQRHHDEGVVTDKALRDLVESYKIKKKEKKEKEEEERMAA